MKTIIKSKKFLLRPIVRSDKKSLIRNINDRYIYKYTLTIPYPYTSKDADKWIRHCLNLKRKKKLTEVNFVIDIDGNLIGGIGLTKIEKHKAEIGYWIGKKHRNKGVISEAIKLVTSFAFKKLRVVRVYARINPKNKASARVLEKNGYKFEGIMRKNILKDGEFIDGASYAKVR